jgi:hypothetical protein
LAIIETLKAWRSLLAPLVILSDEQQIGLWGEIFLLRLMLRASKPINCWTGPLGEPHDFRIGTLEVEVKTTKSQHRLHVINGLDQLSSSIGHKLVLVSLQVAPAGAHAGESLSQLVNSTLQEATKTEGIWKSNSLRELINSIGYREEHSGFYQGPFILRTIPRAVPVDSLFPSITKGRLSQVLGNDVFRIGDVSYRIDVEGLGKEVKPESLIEEIFELV